MGWLGAGCFLSTVWYVVNEVYESMFYDDDRLRFSYPGFASLGSALARKGIIRLTRFVTFFLLLLYIHVGALRSMPTAFDRLAQKDREKKSSTPGSSVLTPRDSTVKPSRLLEASSANF